MEHSRQSPLVSETSSRDEVYGQTLTESATAKRKEIQNNLINRFYQKSIGLEKFKTNKNYFIFSLIAFACKKRSK